MRQLIVNQPHFLGTARLLQLTEGLDPERKDELLRYISQLETHQKTLSEAISEFWNKTSRVVEDATRCYFCHGVGCDRCNAPPKPVAIDHHEGESKKPLIEKLIEEYYELDEYNNA